MSHEPPLEPATGGGALLAAGAARDARQDPKQVFRLIERALAGQAEGRDVEGLLRWFADQLLVTLGGGAGAATGLYGRAQGRFVLRHAVGEAAGELPKNVADEDAALRPLLGPGALDPGDSGGSGPPTPTGDCPGRPTSGCVVEGPRGRYLLLALLPPGCDGAHVGALLDTLRTVLAARTLQERWGRSLRAAADIQRGLLPAGPPSIPGLEMAGRSVAAEEVGGDFYDFHDLGAGTVGVAIGDASGHGLPAALVARDVVMGLRMGMDGGMRASRVFERINRVLHAGIPFSSFASAFFAEMQADGALLYVSAGHPPPLRVGPRGTRPLVRTGPALGPLPDGRYEVRTEQLEEGDLLVLYTDGIVERRNWEGSPFGEDRLVWAVREQRGVPAAGVVEAVFAAAQAFGGSDPWEDDATLVVVRRTGSA